MVHDYMYAPHCDFYIDKVVRPSGYTMDGFHMHKKYELYYQITGNRRYFIEDSAYFVRAGDVVLIDKDEVHKTGSPDNSAHSRIVVNFNEEYILPLAQHFTGVDMLSIFRDSTKVLNLNMPQQSLVAELLDRIMRHKDDEGPQATAMRQLLLCELLLDLGACMEQQHQRKEETARIHNKTIDSIISYIATNYTEKLTLTDIAARFYVSPYYLSRLFKRTTNLTLVEYITSVRLRAAKTLLETTDLKVGEVAERSGFSTAAHFTRMFKSGTGLSPHQYRKLYQTRRGGAA